MRKLVAFFIMGLVMAGIIGSYRFYVRAIRYALDPENTFRIIVDVSKGSSAADVADLLYGKGLIRSRAAFRFYLKREGVQNQIKAGRMVLSPSLKLPEIVEALVTGKSEELPVTLLEGWTAEQMAAHLEETGLTAAEDFLNCLKTCDFSDFEFLPERYREGYLYPDTYFVDPTAFSNEHFIARLLRTFENRLADEKVAIEKSGRTLEEIVILASIIEREERDPDERQKVAGILWKRLDAGRGLDADATILYALGRTKGGLTQQDLRVDSPYNTRKYRGLPPAPISNPSLTSLRAALYPQDSPYWYYLHDSKGQVHYGKNLDEHNENKARYLR